jgi:hypothetical protein
MARKRTSHVNPLRSQAGRIGAYSKHARHNARESTQAAREAFNRRFIDEVDPQRTLPEAERERRATSARKAHFARLALQSAKARARKKAINKPHTASES